MKKIELKDLKKGDEVTLVYKTRWSSATFIDRHPKHKEVHYFYRGSSIDQCFSMQKIYMGNVQLYLGYDSKKVGEILVSNLKKEVKSITEIYIEGR